VSVRDLDFRTSATVSAAGTTYGDTVEVDSFNELTLFIRVTAQGSYTDETLDVSMQTKDPSGNWYDLTDAEFTQIGNKTASLPYSEYMTIIAFGSQVRIKIVAAGTSVSYTFSVEAYGKKLWR